ncbi:VOC family protein [Shewanella sp. KX20019]|uniref:VOC family protein n=1 Tax=Shewanella sp. KX20019 TaxID=2803864 RepID=UPI0019265193|nr:VOC family protein [Shewanella sp. KX20019]QQX80598.1 VOC family protein [Shewanella sp. KX20019]
MKVNQYLQGQPCWVELASRDITVSKPFYRGLFGWGIVDLPVPQGTYSMFNLEGDDLGAMYQLPDEMVKAGDLSRWLIYFAVDNLDNTLVDVRGAGGTIVLGPHDVGESGRMATILDPEGAKFALWQAKDHIGAHRAAEANTLCWVELACRQTEAAKSFYSKVLGWGSQASNMENMEYTEWQVGTQDIGGMLKMTSEWGDMPAHWMSYFTVDDCNAKAKQVVELGGAICVPPTDIANVGRFSVVNDPNGAVFSIIELRMGT